MNNSERFGKLVQQYQAMFGESPPLLHPREFEDYLQLLEQAIREKKRIPYPDELLPPGAIR